MVCVYVGIRNMALTDRQYNWIVKRIDNISYECGFKGEDIRTLIDRFMSSRTIRNCGTWNDWNTDTYKLYVFTYHKEPMFLEIELKGGFYHWHVGYVSAWWNERTRKRMIDCVMIANS